MCRGCDTSLCTVTSGNDFVYRLQGDFSTPHISQCTNKVARHVVQKIIADNAHAEAAIWQLVDFKAMYTPAVVGVGLVFAHIAKS